MKITKTDFKAILEALKSQYDYDKAKSDKLSEIYGSDVMPSDNSRLTNVLFDLLHQEFPPEDNYCEIQSFCYELDFGRIADDVGYVTVDDLWDSLIAKKASSINVTYDLVKE